MPSPPQLANLVSWYKADTGVFQDTGGTTPATTTGQNVALWQDQSGQGNHVLQATTANKPTYATGALNGLPSINFVSSGSQYLKTSGTATLGISTANWWIAAVYITPAVWPLYWNSLLSMKTGAYSFYAPGKYTPRTIVYYSTIPDIFSDVLALNTAYWSELTCTSGTMTLFHAPVGTSPAADANTFSGVTSMPNGPFAIGSDQGGDYFSGQICEILVYNTALNSTDQASLESYLNVRYNAAYVAFMPWLFNSEDC